MTDGSPAPAHRVEDAVTVHSMGGLGNQLFIYGAGLAAARASRARLRVDVGQHAARVDRPCLLRDLGLPAEYVDLGFPAVPSRLRRRAMRGTLGAPWGCTYREAGFTFAPDAVKQGPGKCLFGYFQSWRYLATVADELRDRLRRLETEVWEHFGEVSRAVSDAGAVALHVRRGDYGHGAAAAHHGLAGQRFYRDAVSTLSAMGMNGPVYLFSDDLPAAWEELSDVPGLTSLDPQPPTDIAELLLMSRASALVTANSSFSWWAGWLGDRPGRPVVAPRPWFDDPGVDSRDLLPPHWLTLDRRSL